MKIEKIFFSLICRQSRAFWKRLLFIFAQINLPIIWVHLFGDYLIFLELFLLKHAMLIAKPSDSVNVTFSIQVFHSCYYNGCSLILIMLFFQWFRFKKASKYFLMCIDTADSSIYSINCLYQNFQYLSEAAQTFTFNLEDSLSCKNEK